MWDPMHQSTWTSPIKALATTVGPIVFYCLVQEYGPAFTNLVASLLIVVRPGAPSSDALCS